MSPADLHDVAREALSLVLWLSLPILGVALLSGILSGLFQSFTRMSEPAIGHVARVAAVLVVAVVALPWVAGRVSEFAVLAWGLIAAVSR
jgi:flagellar biosynthesis protein FliQ